jgi:hypothetical protein
MIWCDVRDVASECLQGFDAVLHLAGLSNDPLGDLNPQSTYDINHLASVRLARLAKASGVKRFVFASSCSNYGASGDDYLDEGASPSFLPLCTISIQLSSTSILGVPYLPMIAGFLPHLPAQVVVDRPYLVPPRSETHGIRPAEIVVAAGHNDPHWRPHQSRKPLEHRNSHSSGRLIGVTLAEL